VLYRQGAKWYVTDQEVVELCAEEQAKREVPDDWIPLVAKWLESPTVPTGAVVAGTVERTRLDLTLGISTGDALLGAVGMLPSAINQSATIRMGHVLQACGWEPTRHPVRRNGQRVRVYKPAQSAQSPESDCAGSTVPPDPASNTHDPSPDTVGTYGSLTYTHEGTGRPTGSTRGEHSLPGVKETRMPTVSVCRGGVPAGAAISAPEPDDLVDSDPHGLLDPPRWDA
jgi:hypothetical protein